jgi:hypothetical protein
MATSPTAQILFPEPQRRRPGGSIRWAIGSRDGARSQSWSIFGNPNHSDIYIGPRTQTGVIKLSLHKSGIWRMAWTEVRWLSVWPRGRTAC